MKPVIKARLKLVRDGNFRKKPKTLWNELPAADKRQVKPGCCACIVSLTGKMMYFIWRPYSIGIYKGKKQQIYCSARIELEHGTFNGAMLRNYAETVGIELIGLPRFEDHPRFANLKQAA